jgi:hypothetical protein
MFPANDRSIHHRFHVPRRILGIALSLILASMLVGQGNASSSGGANVVVENILITDVPTPDGKSLLSVVETFKNQGGAASSAMQVQETMNGQAVGQFKLPSLAPGKSHTRVTKATASSGASINWTVLWNEANDQYSVTYTVH